MSTITLIHETDIDASARSAWRVVADYSRDIEWRHGVLGMVPSPPGLAEVGTATATAGAVRRGGRLVELERHRGGRPVRPGSPTC